MAIVFWDSFNGRHLKKGWFTGSGLAINTTKTVDSGACAQVTGAAGKAGLNLTADDEYYFHWWFQFDNLTSVKVFSWSDPTNTTELGSFRISSSNKPTIWIGTAAVTYTGTTTLTNSINYHAKLHIKIHDTTGIAHLEIDGIEEIDQTNVDTKPGSDTQMGRVDWLNSGGNQYFDSVLIDDSQFHGLIRMVSALPTANGSDTAWTASAGSIFQTVDDVTANDDTDYSSETTNGDRYTVEFPAFAISTTASVLAVGGESIVKKISSGQVKSLLREGGTLTVGSVQDVPTSYGVIEQLHLVNPRTSAGWLVSDLNDSGDKIQIGLEAVI